MSLYGVHVVYVCEAEIFIKNAFMYLRNKCLNSTMYLYKLFLSIYEMKGTRVATTCIFIKKTDLMNILLAISSSFSTTLYFIPYH